MELRNFTFGCFNRLAFSNDAAFIVFIDEGINTKECLMKFYFYRLHFPDYFGFNWDALYDCLRDCSWIKEFEIVIVHTDLPQLPIEEVKIYCDILMDCVDNLKDDPDNKLTVYFPQYAKKIIESL